MGAYCQNRPRGQEPQQSTRKKMVGETIRGKGGVVCYLYRRSEWVSKGGSAKIRKAARKRSRIKSGKTGTFCGSGGNERVTKKELLARER